jgi:anaerobic selenocysteine-containing dehydrogenase
MNRRQFLNYLSGAGLAFASSSWLGDRLWGLYQEGKLLKPDGAPLEQWTNTACGLCPGGCGLRVRSYEGFPVQVAGNPLSPVNRGGLCPYGAAGLQVLYHPDRIQEPLLRTGERGGNRWKAISWNEAIQHLQERLQKLRQQGDPHRLVFLEADAGSTIQSVIAQFMRAYGSPNIIREQGPDLAEVAFRLTQGGETKPAYDLPNARFILSFGFDLLEAEGAPVWQSLCYGQFRTARPEARGTLVQVEPHLSLTATQADQWVPVRPGTEAAFALGIAHIMINENLYDPMFVQEHTYGFKDWVDKQGQSHLGFQTLVLREYVPATVSQLTGVSVEILERVARAFGGHAAPLAVAGRASSSHTNGLYTQLAVQALNALKGNLGRPGGPSRPQSVPLNDLEAFDPDKIALAGLAKPSLDDSDQWPFAQNRIGTFLERLEQGKPYPVDTLLVSQANPLFHMPDPRRLEKVFERIPFVVSFASFMDETTSKSDLILPSPTGLESWGDVAEVPGVAWSYAAIQQPAVKPLHQVRHTGDVLIQLAHALGDSTAQAFPEPDFLEVLKRRYRGLFKSGRGRIASLHEGTAPPETFEAFWSQLLDQGIWMEESEPAGKTPTFGTPSGKYEFFVQELEKHPMLQKGTETAFLPHLDPPQFSGDFAKYPYHLFVFDRNTLFGGKGALLPLMMEMAGFREDIPWDSWVEINPVTGKQLGVNNGDSVWIESDQGRVRARVKLWPGVSPDVVAMPRGLGHESYGRYAQGRGVNPNLLIARVQDPLTGGLATLATRVQIVKI